MEQVLPGNEIGEEVEAPLTAGEAGPRGASRAVTTGAVSTESLLRPTGRPADKADAMPLNATSCSTCGANDARERAAVRRRRAGERPSRPRSSARHGMPSARLPERIGAEAERLSSMATQGRSRDGGLGTCMLAAGLSAVRIVNGAQAGPARTAATPAVGQMPAGRLPTGTWPRTRAAASSSAELAIAGAAFGNGGENRPHRYLGGAADVVTFAHAANNLRPR